MAHCVTESNEMFDVVNSENHLSNIRSQILMPLTSVHSLSLSDNPWKCDCALKSMRKYLLATSRINVVDQPECTANKQIWTQMGSSPSYLLTMTNI